MIGSLSTVTELAAPRLLGALQPADYFVATIALAIAVFLLYAAASNRDRFYSTIKLQWLEKKWGRATLRIIYLAAAFLMGAAGVLLLLEMAPAQRRSSPSETTFTQTRSGSFSGIQDRDAHNE